MGMKMKEVVSGLGSSINASNKNRFHNVAKRRLRKLAREYLGLREDEFDVRSCKGGPAVGGEAILHTDKIYVAVHATPCMGKHILYRTCNGRRDYCGGRNNWADISELDALNVFAARLKMLMQA